MKDFNIVASHVPRNDAHAKARGSAVYTDDMKAAGMLHGRICEPFAMPGSCAIDHEQGGLASRGKCVITGEDTPKIKYGQLAFFPETQDEYLLALKSALHRG